MVQKVYKKIYACGSSRSRLRWQNCVLIIRDLFHPLNHLAVKRFLDSDVRHGTVALAPAPPVTSATLLSNDRFIVIPLLAGGLASHSSLAFAHLYKNECVVRTRGVVPIASMGKGQLEL